MSNKLIIDTLKPLNVPVSFQVYKGTATTYITFFEYNQFSGIVADDKEQTTKYFYQVDVWSKGDYTNLVQQVKDTLTQAGFFRINEFDLYEDNTGYYHKVIRLSKI